jgi:hypothetical protein
METRGKKKRPSAEAASEKRARIAPPGRFCLRLPADRGWLKANETG